MPNRLKSLSEGSQWRLLVSAGKRALENEGYALSRVPGRGLANVWTAERGGKKQIASIRTTRDRWFAFPPLEGGSRWKTLDDADLVVVAAVDSPESPAKVEVYLFPADEVRRRFNAAYAARRKAGRAVRDNFGMWVALDPYEHGVSTDVGSGLAIAYEPIAVYSIDDLIRGNTEDEVNLAELSSDMKETRESPPETIAEVMAWARERIAEIAGVDPGAVKLELKLGT